MQSIDKYKPDAELKTKRLRLKDDNDAGARKKRKTRAASQTAIHTSKDQDPAEETRPLTGAFHSKIFDSRAHKYFAATCSFKKAFQFQTQAKNSPIDR